MCNKKYAARDIGNSLSIYSRPDVCVAMENPVVLSLLLWKWKQYAPPKYWYPSSKIHRLITENQSGHFLWACSTHGSSQRSVQNVGGQLETKRKFERFRCRWEDNIKRILKENIWNFRLDSSGLGYDPVMFCWEHANKHSVFRDVRVNLGYLSECYLLKKDSAPSSSSLDLDDSATLPAVMMKLWERWSWSKGASLS
jgi:hypothetical protein